MHFRVIYEYSNEFETNKEVLIANQSNAVYIKTAKSANTASKSLEYKNGIYTAPAITNGTSEVQYFSSYNNNQIILNTIANDKVRYIVNDSTISMDWKLSKNDSKHIGVYLCKKATLNWRGRFYTAYYTEDIALPTGPFKFKGLPGMILEISTGTSSNFHRWVAQKIEYPVVYLDNEVPKVANYDYKRITLKQFVDIGNQLQEQKYRAYQARLGKDTKIKKVVSSRLGPELFYEWEENKNGTRTFKN